MTLTKHRLQLIVFLFFALFVFQGCTTKEEIYIVIGENASKPEQITASHLKNDLEKVLDKQIQLIDEKSGLPSSGQIFLLGTLSSNRTIGDLARKKAIFLSEDFPGNRGGIWATVNYQKQKMAVLAGADVQGMQYAVYEYCENYLGVDPFSYWTGNTPDINSSLNITNLHNKIIPPPEIPILCYFENDVDELANIKLPKLEYDWENYTEMINTLVRIKYNAIQLYDMLGRPEFFLRPEYKSIRPDYDIRISYIDSMINYAHDMGMKVQIDMALGYKIKPIAPGKADCWAKNKQEWLDTWKYYLTETPICKADIFALRLRNQVWDWEYRSSCGEDKVDVFNEVYAVLGNLIDEYKPGATKVVLCYHDGMEMFNNGFDPPKDWIVAWSDNGWVDFDYMPDSTKGYDFGTYMHAGFWLNHTIHDPCPVKIDTIMKKMVNCYGANKYCMVNGQQFRPFMLNLLAFSKMADAPNNFNGEQFYKDWVNYYFGEKAGAFAIRSMKKLHKAQFDGVSYVEHLWEIREAISYLSNAPIERPGKISVSYEYNRVENDYEHVEKRYKLIKEALLEAKNGEILVDKNELFYNNYIVLPTEIYADLLTFESGLHQMAKLKKQFEDSGDIIFLKKAIRKIDESRTVLKIIYERRINGDANLNWEGWYNPDNHRPNNDFPTFEMLDVVERNLKSLK